MSAVIYETGAAYEGENKALIGYRSVITPDNVSGSSALSFAPVENVATGTTWDAWVLRDFQEDAVLTVDLESQSTVDYIAIAAHNLYEVAQLSATGLELYFGTSGSPELVPIDTSSITDNGPIIVHLQSRAVDTITLTIRADDVGLSALRIASVYAGQLLQMQRTEYQGWTPPNLGRTDTTVPNVSDAGAYLGTIVTQSLLKTTASWDHLTPDWYRDNFDPFVLASRDRPFFIAWRPSEFPGDVVYGWRTGDASPSNSAGPNLMSVSFQMTAVSHD